VDRLLVEVRTKTLALRRLAAEREHVGGDVAAVDVEPGAKKRHEEATGAAGDVERRLAAFLDDAPEVRDLRPADVELGPPARDNAVVPGGGVSYVASSATSQRAISA
jgi:hypothetical protein